MLFNSLPFFVFLPVVFCLYWFLFNRTLRGQNYLLLAASYFFYGWWSPKFLLLLALSTFLDYCYGFFVASPNRTRAKLFLWLGMLNNLGLLAVFKYYDFFATELQQLLLIIGWNIHPTLLKLALPVGISFYTFHGMSYVIDIYRGIQKPVRNFVDYAVFVCFFPLLVAGPIERAHHLLPQVQQKRLFNYTQAVAGCRLILYGLFKKVVIADNLSVIANAAFNHPTGLSSIDLITGAIAFAFQIYGDFSGYSDIALGCAKLLGFELLSNFRFPYFSRDVAEFWRRWHISLSTWFRDYLYIPLGGSRNGKQTALRNTFIIFLVSGFWHGASWNFIVWGLLHALGFLPLLLYNRNRTNIGSVTAEGRWYPNGIELLQMLSTFGFVTVAWIFFRAKSMPDALFYIGQLTDSLLQHPLALFNVPVGAEAAFYIIPLLVTDWYMRHNERQLRVPNHKFLRRFIYVLLAALILYSLNLFSEQEKIEFIYFQF